MCSVILWLGLWLCKTIDALQLKAFTRVVKELTMKTPADETVSIHIILLAGTSDQ